MRGQVSDKETLRLFVWSRSSPANTHVESGLVELGLVLLVLEAFVQLRESDHGHRDEAVGVRVVEPRLLPNHRVDS